jgi:hypothetical protein
MPLEYNISGIRSALRISEEEAHSCRKPGPRLLITTEMQDALRDILSCDLDCHLYELADKLLKDFDKAVSLSTISRTLNKVMRWSKKLNQRLAKEQRADLRDFYMDKIAN